MTMSLPRLLTALVAPILATCFALPLAAAPADPKAQADPKLGQGDDAEATPAPLMVGAMAIASDINLAVEAMAVDVKLDRVSYSYRLRNKGQAKLSLAASVELPDLENSEDLSYDLPVNTANDPVALAVKANDQPVTTTPNVSALALGIDHQAEIKAAGLPLIPFGPAQEKALAAVKPDVLLQLAHLGLVTPREQPDAPVAADWTLHVVHGWTQVLDPGAVANIVVSFAPVKAIYHVDAAALVGFNAIKDQVCLTPAILAAARALLKGKDAKLDVADITLSNEGPARWLDNPAASLAVSKPQPNAVVAFCGLDAPSAGKPVVTGTMTGSGEGAGLRLLVFSAGG